MPTIFLQPFFGVLADKVNKKLLVIATDCIRGVCVLYIALGVMGSWLTEWHLLFVTLIISTAEAFRMPASSTMIPQLLDIEDYDYGISLNHGLSSTVELIGIGSAGVIIGLFGVENAILVDMATFFICAFLIMFIKLKPIEKQEKANESYFTQLTNGFKFLKGSPIILYFMTISLLLNALTSPYNSLQAPLVSEILKSNEIMLSVLGGSLSLGGIVGSLIYPKVRQKVSSHEFIIQAGYSLILIYLYPLLIGNFITIEWMKYILIFVGGVIAGLQIGLVNTYIGVTMMKIIKKEYLGRVNAIINASAVAAMPISAFITSILVLYISTQAIFIISILLGVLVLVTVCSKKFFNKMVNENKLDET